MTVTGSVAGMVFVPFGVAPPEATPSVAFTVTAAPEQIDAAVQARLATARAQVATQTRTLPRRGVVNPLKTSTTFGTCGSSFVTLNGTSRYTVDQGKVSAGWDLTPGVVTGMGAYETDVMIYSNPVADLWTDHMQDFGTAGPRMWRDTMLITIPKTQEYGAHFYVGSVRATVNGNPGTCVTKGPRVDNLKLWK